MFSNMAKAQAAYDNMTPMENEECDHCGLSFDECKCFDDLDEFCDQCGWGGV